MVSMAAPVVSTTLSSYSFAAPYALRKASQLPAGVRSAGREIPPVLGPLSKLCRTARNRTHTPAHQPGPQRVPDSGNLAGQHGAGRTPRRECEMITRPASENKRSVTRPGASLVNEPNRQLIPRLRISRYRGHMQNASAKAKKFSRTYGRCPSAIPLMVGVRATKDRHTLAGDKSTPGAIDSTGKVPQRFFVVFSRRAHAVAHFPERTGCRNLLPHLHLAFPVAWRQPPRFASRPVFSMLPSVAGEIDGRVSRDRLSE